MRFQPRSSKIVTIVALGETSYERLISVNKNPIKEDEQVFTVNAGALAIRHDVVFDMHTPEWLEDKCKKENVFKRREVLKNHDKPIVMPRALPEYPTSLTYPLRMVVEKTNSTYFRNGLSYMLAIALVMKPETVRLFGCDFSYKRDDTWKDEPGRACCEYWVGRLIGSGIKVEIPSRSHFMDLHSRTFDENLKGQIYGYHERMEWEFPETGGQGRFIGPDYDTDNASI